MLIYSNCRFQLCIQYNILIQPHFLMQKLSDMNVNSNIILWINEFLTNHVQYVNFTGTKSGTLLLTPNRLYFECFPVFVYILPETD